MTTHYLTTIEEIRALADPLRLRILEAFAAGGSWTTKQLAEQIGENLTKLYHHVDVLEKCGLIRLVDTRRIRGATEKHYETVADRFAVDEDLFDLLGKEGDEPMRAIILGALETTAIDVRRSIDAGLFRDLRAGDAVLARLHVRGGKERIDEVRRKLLELIELSEGAEEPERDAGYGLTIAFYPSLADAAATGTGDDDDINKEQRDDT